MPPKYRGVIRYPLSNHDPAYLVLPIVLVRDPYRWMQSMVSGISSSILAYELECPLTLGLYSVKRALMRNGRD